MVIVEGREYYTLSETCAMAAEGTAHRDQLIVLAYVLRRHRGVTHFSAATVEQLVRRFAPGDKEEAAA